MSLLTRRARPDLKPPLGASIDPTHPLAHRLLAFFPFGDGHQPLNAASPPQKWVLQNTAPTFVDTPVGLSPKFDGSSRQAYILASSAGAGTPRLADMQPLDLPLSFAILINFVDFLAIHELFFAGIHPGTGDIGGLFSNVFSSKFGCCYGDGAGSGSANNRNITGSTVLTAGIWYVLSASLRGPTDMSIYVNGIDDAGVLGGTGASLGYPPSGNANMSIGYGGSAAVGTKATIGWLAYWNRNLTADEHLLLAKGPGPFSLFRTRTMFAPLQTLVQSLAVPFIPSASHVYAPAHVEGRVSVPFIASHTSVHAPSVQASVTVPFIASTTVVHAPTVEHDALQVPFTPSRTRLYPLSVFSPDTTYSGPGNGGETFQVAIAPNGSTLAATLVSAIGTTGSSLQLTGGDVASFPTSEPFIVTIDGEQLLIQNVGGTTYRIRGRGLGNTTAASHLAGATVTWNDSYDMAIVATDEIDADFTDDVGGTGTATYHGFLICFDSTQAHLGPDRYPAHVSELVGVFPAGTGTSGTNRLDGPQPSAVHTADGASDDCPAAMCVPARIAINIDPGDVAVVRFTNPAGAKLTLNDRAVALQSWYGLLRVDATNHDVTTTDPNGNIVDGTVNDEWFNPSATGIAPATGLPTSLPVPYTSVTLPGTDRVFTRVDGDVGIPVGVLAVRQQSRRVPYWQSYDWVNFVYVYTGFGPNATFVQLVGNPNGLTGAEPGYSLPGSEDIPGPDAVWDDGSYHFGASWGVLLLKASVVVIGPHIGGEGGGGRFDAFQVGFGGGGHTLTDPTGYTGPPGTGPAPPVAGGSGGNLFGGLLQGLFAWVRF